VGYPEIGAMNGHVYCHGCCRRVEVPEGFTRTKLRCPDCGVFNDVSKAAVEAAKANRKQSTESDDGIASLLEPDNPPPLPRKVAPPPVAKEENEEPATYSLQAPDEPKPAPTPKEEEREVLIHGTEEDDGQPYRVTGDAATKSCPECGKKIPKRATICTQCGYHFETGKKAERVYQPINREWENGWPMKKRIMIFVVLQVVNFITLVAAVVTGHGRELSLVIILMSVGLQAFLVGTYDRLNLTRTAKNKVTITRTWRYAFIPRLPATLRWKEHECLTIVQENDFDPIDWAIFFVLLGYCCVPAIAYWYFAIRPDKFCVFLCKDHGFPETMIFRTRNQELAKEIQTVVSDVTGLPVRN
jgi:hypothetical protein